MEIKEIQNVERCPVSFFRFHFITLVIIILCFSGGILGWDPVHTTCIPDEMMMML